MISDKQYYLDIFKVGDADLQKLTETALSHGGDYCDLYFENTMNQTHQLRDGEVSSGGLAEKRQVTPTPKAPHGKTWKAQR